MSLDVRNVCCHDIVNLSDPLLILEHIRYDQFVRYNTKVLVVYDRVAAEYLPSVLKTLQAFLVFVLLHMQSAHRLEKQTIVNVVRAVYKDPFFYSFPQKIFTVFVVSPGI